MALLCLQDDGDDSGEWIRIRTSKTLIGRTEGDLRIPHDAMISGRHAELTRALDRGRYRWSLTDLESSNGTFARISRAVLHHNQELLLGSRRYRFNAAPQGAALAQVPDQAEGSEPQATRGWQGVKPTDLIPSLVEITPQGEGQRYFLQQPDNFIGRQAGTCSVVIADDPLLCPCHARLMRDPKGAGSCKTTSRSMESGSGSTN